MTFIPLDHETPALDHEVLKDLASDLNHQRFRHTGGRHSAITAIEVGSWTGSTALTLASFCSELYCVDTFEGSDRLKPIADRVGKDEVFKSFCHNMGDRLYKSVIPFVGKSLDWAAVWPFPVDLIFLDADHEYQSVREDIEAWRPHCKGIFCGHDYGNMFPGVPRAVHELFKSEEINVRGNVWWVDLRV